jgi:hypothetical protein
MRISISVLAAACWIAAAGPLAAQQAGNSVATDHKDVGKVQARVQKYDQALGVVSELRRSPVASVECDGVCYFPNSSKSVSWKCEPERRCDLRCTVSPPVGGCN